MSYLNDYSIVESVVEYSDDPLCIGRVRASIPGVIEHTTTDNAEALPWIRPFKMYGYQTFSKPLQGQKIWVIGNNSNYNEFWWFPYFEPIDIVQGYLNARYDDDPDVLHARDGYVSPVMSTWDCTQGYKWVIGEDYIDFFPTREYKLKVNECNINITAGNVLQCGGDNSSAGEYEPAVMGHKCEKLRGNIQKACDAVATAAATCSTTVHLESSLKQLAKSFTEGNILCDKCHVN